MHGSLFLEAQGFEPRIPIRSPEIYLLPVASICLQCVFVDALPGDQLLLCMVSILK